ncbi:MAG: tetratricopeptide repeat protein [Prevotella sp.]|nr:tetratricopeptide repeat protein [Prevotella sp.]
MWTNRDCNDAQSHLKAQRLGKAISMMENYFFSHPNQYETGAFQLLRDDYDLLKTYWRNGAYDPQRDALYQQLIRRMYTFIEDFKWQNRIANSVCHSSADSLVRQHVFDWSSSQVRMTLESFVSNIAMLELEPPHTRQQQQDALYLAHQQFREKLFNYLWLSTSWKENRAQNYKEMILSPTIDPVDQQLMVSAVTLSCMNSFCINKFRLLTEVFQESLDESVRQRALVGWALCVDADSADIFHEQQPIVTALCQQESCRQQLTELQIQIIYCMLADEDSRKIKEEIIPDIMEGQQMRITRQGIIEAEDDQLENILHPETAERNMERMEASMKKMADMQKSGSDIYFAGFSQMKRFPFFSQVVNWFLPFYPQHPSVSAIWQQSKGKRFLQDITRLGAFCDSDKYSFVLAFEQVYRQLPAEMVDLINKGEAYPTAIGGEVPLEEQNQPAFIRRQYLQNLYRFFRLFPYRGEFCNPFAADETQLPKVLFSACPMFRGSDFEAHFIEIASFLIKRKKILEAYQVLQNIGLSHQQLSYYLMSGHLVSRYPSVVAKYVTNSADYYFQQALNIDPDNTKALQEHARFLFIEKEYQEALDVYNRLLALLPENMNVELNVAVCMVKLKNYDDALKILFRLNYNYPDQTSITRVLAWALTLTHKYPQAMKLYGQLLSLEHRHDEDVLNYGYCLWFQNDIQGAVSLFSQFLLLHANDVNVLEELFLNTDRRILADQNISDTDIMLMLDVLSKDS